MSSGFSKHRNGPVLARYMVDVLGFATEEEGMALRNEYFQKYHSSVKGLTVADEEGKLPKGKHFAEESLGEWFAAECDFAAYVKPQPAFIEALQTLPQKKVIFSNGPRKCECSRSLRPASCSSRRRQAGTLIPRDA